MALALPLLAQRRRLVQHVAHAEHDPRAAARGRVQRARELVAEAPGLLVHDQQIRHEAAFGGADDPGAQAHGLFQRQAQVMGGVVAVGQLHDAGEPHVVHAVREVEAPRDGRAREDQRGEARIPVHQPLRDGARAAQMAQPERVVTVQESAARGRRMAFRECRPHMTFLPGVAPPLRRGPSRNATSFRGRGESGVTVAACSRARGTTQCRAPEPDSSPQGDRFGRSQRSIIEKVECAEPRWGAVPPSAEGTHA